MTASAPRNRRILVVEDDFLVALDLEMALQGAEAIVLGPAGRIRVKLELVAREPEIAAAILDVKVAGALVFPVADALLAREPPDAIPARFAGVTTCQKPTASSDLVRHVAGLLSA